MSYAWGFGISPVSLLISPYLEVRWRGYRANPPCSLPVGKANEVAGRKDRVRQG